MQYLHFWDLVHTYYNFGTFDFRIYNCGILSLQSWYQKQIHLSILVPNLQSWYLNLQSWYFHKIVVHPSTTTQQLWGISVVPHSIVSSSQFVGLSNFPSNLIRSSSDPPQPTHLTHLYQVV